MPAPSAAMHFQLTWTNISSSLCAEGETPKWRAGSCDLLTFTDSTGKTYGKKTPESLARLGKLRIVALNPAGNLAPGSGRREVATNTKAEMSRWCKASSVSSRARAAVQSQPQARHRHRGPGSRDLLRASVRSSRLSKDQPWTAMRPKR